MCVLIINPRLGSSCTPKIMTDTVLKNRTLLTVVHLSTALITTSSTMQHYSNITFFKDNAINNRIKLALVVSAIP